MSYGVSPSTQRTIRQGCEAWLLAPPQHVRKASLESEFRRLRMVMRFQWKIERDIAREQE